MIGTACAQPGISAEDEVRQTLAAFFEALNKGDSAVLRLTAVPGAMLYSVEDDGTVEQVEFRRFLQVVGKPRSERWDERLSYTEVRVDGRMATAWVPYRFFANNRLSHCGVNAITLVRPASSPLWLIHSVTDTRHLQGCDTYPYTTAEAEAAIEQLMDRWHLDAANANAEGFFAAIAPSGYYLGTDASETWTKDAFYLFAKPFFDKGKAWNFKPLHRQIFVSPSGTTAWIHEHLDTWMGTCRGTAVLERGPEHSWRIQQYNLSILVPNELVDSYLHLLQQHRDHSHDHKK